MESLTVLDFSGKNIRFERRGDRVWVSLTDMAKATGKQVGHWNSLGSTVEFLGEVEICKETILRKYAYTLNLSNSVEAFSIFAKIENAQKAREASDKQEGIIYIISNGSKYHKLGFSQNVKERMNSLQTANGHNLKLVKTFKGCIKSEMILHKMLESFKINGEWYKKDVLKIVTQELIDSLSSSDEKDVYSCYPLIIEQNQNGTLEKQGVWAISLVSIDFAEWCEDVELENWVVNQSQKLKDSVATR